MPAQFTVDFHGYRLVDKGYDLLAKHTNKSPGLCLCHTASSCCNAADPVPVTFHPAPLDPLPTISRRRRGKAA
jgi:hypothetical protein